MTIMTLLVLVVGGGGEGGKGGKGSKLPALCPLHSQLDVFFAITLYSDNYTLL